MAQAASETPLPLSLLIADRVYHDRASGKWVVAGIFSAIRLSSLPRTYDQIDVFFQITNVTGTPDLHLRLEHADDGEAVLDVGGPVQASSPLEVMARKISLRNVPLRRAGKYWLMLTSDGQILTQVPLHVVEQKPEDGEPSGPSGASPPPAE